MSEFRLPKPQAQPKSNLRRALKTQVNVLWALMLHDIKSRFFGNGLGYVVTIIWPSTHIAIVIVAFTFTKRAIPYGSSPLLYASTCVMPFIAWNYISRFTMMGMLQNRSFLAYPVIKPLDVMFARLALETISTFIVTIGLISVNALYQVDIVPYDMKDAVFGMLSAILLGYGFGILNSVIVLMFPLWIIGYIGILITFWLTSGMVINPETLPSELGYWISWNPLMHCVEWIRLGYYNDFPAHLLNKTYVLCVGSGSLALGLLMERYLKRYFK